MLGRHFMTQEKLIYAMEVAEQTGEGWGWKPWMLHELVNFLSLDVANKFTNNNANSFNKCLKKYSFVSKQNYEHRYIDPKNDRCPRPSNAGPMSFVEAGNCQTYFWLITPTDQLQLILLI